MKQDFVLRYSTHFEELLPLYKEANLEVGNDECRPDGFITSIEVVNRASKRVVGAGTLSYNNVYHLNYLAVEEDMRGKSLGKWMVLEFIEEIKRQNGHSMWLNGRVPGFYRKLGFTEVPIEESPIEVSCGDCLQNKKDCFPAVMKIEF